MSSTQGFFKEVYFADDWVEYDEGWLDGSVVLSDKDREHGTAVTSIIVDGPRLNPDLDDGCGSFRVKHFCVAPGPALQLLRCNEEDIANCGKQSRYKSLESFARI